MQMSKLTDDTITQILFELKIISRYKCGDVIDTTENCLRINESSLRQSIDRSLNGDNRHKALARFKHCVGVAFEYAELLCESKYLLLYANKLAQKDFSITFEELECYDIRIGLLTSIYNHIDGIHNGLSAFMSTYESKNDNALVSDCLVFKKDIAIRLESLAANINMFNLHKSEYEDERDSLHIGAR